jgi:putative transposase
MIRSYKIRLLPTKEQEQKFLQHAGCARFIWNWALNYQLEDYKNGNKKVSAYSTIKLLTSLKKQQDYIWLNDVSVNTLQTVILDLEKAYKRFFTKENKFPKFKSKKNSVLNFPVRSDRFYFKRDVVQIQKVGKVKFQTNYNIPIAKYINPRIKCVNNKWILTFSVEYENQVRNLSENLMGIDLGVKNLVTVAFGDECFVFHNINKSEKMKKLDKKVKHLQRNASRKYRTNGNYEKTNNIIKLEAQIKELYYHISCIRKNYIHQTTHKLIELLPKRIVMEDLNVNGMMKNRHLARVIQEQCFYEFERQMKYKCEWNGIEFIQASRFFPSSKACSCCGQIKKDLKLSDRVYKCDCGNVMDRDYNAAINLMRYVDQLEMATA